MGINVLFYGLLVSLLGYLIQVRPRFYNRYFGVDTWRNLAIADYVRKHKKLPEELPKYMLKGPFDYPPLLNILLALLPKKFAEAYQGFISPIFDSLNNLIVFALTYFLTRDLSLGLFAQLIYIAMPMIVIENASLNARSLGGLLFSVSFLLVIFHSIYPAKGLFIPAIAATTLLLFTQKMAAQALSLLLIAFSLAEKNPVYLVIIGLSVITAVFISKGFYIRILKGQLSVLKYFRLILANRYAHQVRGVTTAGKGGDFIDRIKATIRQYPLFALFSSCPLVTLGFLMALWLLLFPKNIPSMQDSGLSLILYKFSLWLCVLFGLGIITAQFKPFQFMGEGIKYLAYAAMPASFIIVVVSRDLLKAGNNPLPLFFALLALIFSFIQIFLLQNKAVIKDVTRSITPPLRKVMEFLENEPDEVRLATIPFSLSDSVAYFTKSNILSSDSAYVLGHNPDYIDYYPVLRRPLEEILNKHKINFLLIDKNYVTIPELNLSKINIIFETENLCLLKW